MANPNLTAGQMLPGYYGYVDYGPGGSGEGPNNRALLWGYIGSGTATPNMPFRPDDQTDADAKCFKGSDLARAYAAGISQAQSSGADVWLMPITAPSGGTQSTYTLKVYIASTNPSKAGTIQLWIASQPVPAVGFTTSDTATTIGDALASAITSMSNGGGNLPLASAINAAGVVTLTYLHKGTTGEDLPIRCFITPTSGSGVNLSPGQCLFATAATGAGSVVTSFGALTVTTAIANSDTAAAIATKVVASFNASTYPLTAVVDGSVSAQVNFYFNNGWDVRRISAYVVTSTGTTANLGSGATSGAGSSSSLTYNGVQGTSAPSLTTAITNLTNVSKWYRSWSAPWTDAVTLGVLATYMEAAENGTITGQKLQHLTVCGFSALSVDGAIPPAVTPNLTTTPPHYAYGWSPDISVQAHEMAARAAVARAAYWLTTPQKNWNGFQFTSSVQAPILKPKTVPSLDTQNSALRTYALSPWIVGPSGSVEVVKGRTTSLSFDLRLWAWSAEAQAAYHIYDLTQYLPTVFGGGSIVRYSDPKAPGIFDSQSFIDVVCARMRLWEKQGNYDGADKFASAVTAKPNGNNPFREDVDFPESPVIDLDQIVFTSHFQQPPA